MVPNSAPWKLPGIARNRRRVGRKIYRRSSYNSPAYQQSVDFVFCLIDGLVAFGRNYLKATEAPYSEIAPIGTIGDYPDSVYANSYLLIIARGRLRRLISAIIITNPIGGIYTKISDCRGAAASFLIVNKELRVLISGVNIWLPRAPRPSPKTAAFDTELRESYRRSLRCQAQTPARRVVVLDVFTPCISVGRFYRAGGDGARIYCPDCTVSPGPMDRPRTVALRCLGFGPG